MKRFALCQVVVIALVVLAPAALAAPSPADVLPRDCVLYVQVDGSSVQEMAQAFAVPPVAGLFAPVETPFAAIETPLGLPPGRIEAALPHVRSAAFALVGEEPIVVITFDDAAAPEQLLGGILTEEHGLRLLADGRVGAHPRGRHLLLGEPDVVRSLPLDDYIRLSSDAALTEAAAMLSGGPAWGYVNVGALWAEGLDEMMSPYERAEEAAGAAFLGLDKAKFLVCGQGASGNGMLRIVFDGPVAGVAGLLPMEPPETATDVPETAAAAIVVNWADASAFLGGMRDLLLKHDPDHPDTDQQFAMFEQSIGMTLDEVFAQVGSGVAVYLPAAAGGRLMDRASWTVVLKLRDPEAAPETVRQLLAGGMGMPAMPVTHDGMDMFQVPFPPVCYAVAQDRLIVAGSPQAVKAHADWQAAGGPCLALERTDLPLAIYGDLGYLLSSYPGGQSGGKVLIALGRSETAVDVSADVWDLEPEMLQRHLATAYVGTAAAMLMPALGRARGEARKAADRANLHNLGIGLMMAAADRDSVLPPDLAVLLNLGYVDSPEVLVSPQDDAPEPTRPGGPLTSYRYIGSTPPDALPNVIIAYTRKGVFPEGRNVLCLDVAVQWATERRLAAPQGDPRTCLRASYEAVVAAYGGKLTPEVDARLKAFYEIEQ